MSLLILLLVQSRLSSSAPVAVNGDSATATTSWQKDPDGRGTTSLLVSCALTLSLCVYSSIHLNVPERGESKIRYYFRLFRWLLTGIFAPEAVAFAAWRQCSSARALQKCIVGNVGTLLIKEKINQDKNMKKGGLRTDSVVATVQNSWTMAHGFYAGMGGFVVDLGSNPGFVPQEDSRLTFTAHGVKLLYDCGHLPVMQKSEIKDKSKSDNLAKFLVCVQASWMGVQVLGRVVSGLPVTLLEVNTLGHVFCAFVVYLLWWNKPQHINEPTELEGNWVRQLCAFMYMSSLISGEPWTIRKWRINYIERPELSTLCYAELADDPGQAEPQNRDDLIEITTSAPHNENPAHASSSSSTKEGQNIGVESNVVRPLRNAIDRSFSAATTINTSSQPHGFMLKHSELENSRNRAFVPSFHSPNDMEQLHRYQLATEAIRKFPAIKALFKDSSSTITIEDRVYRVFDLADRPKELIHISAGDLPDIDLMQETQGLIMGCVLWCASMTFGALHLAAWNDYFPTDAERWLWRASAIYITFSGGLWVLINLVAHFWKALSRLWDRVNNYDPNLVIRFSSNWFTLMVLGVVYQCWGTAYIFARIFLVVEAFISIRQLPVAAYNTTEWAQIIPHL